MHPTEREVLQDATSDLQEKLTNIQPILDYLQEQQVLTAHDCTRINAEVSPERKVITFLLILQYKESREESTFDQLLKGLEETDNQAAATYLRSLKKTTAECYDKLREQLPGWLRGNYTVQHDSVTEMQQLVKKVQRELYTGLREASISSLMSEILAEVFPSAVIEQDLQRLHRVVVNVIAVAEKRKGESKKAQPTHQQRNEQLKNPAPDASHTTEQNKVKAAHSVEGQPGHETVEAPSTNPVDELSDQTSTKEPTEGKTMDKEPEVVEENPQSASELLSEQSCHDSHVGFPLDLRSNDVPPAAEARVTTPVEEEFLFKDMDTWRADDVCAWLATIPEMDLSAIDLFRKAKIRGKSLKKMSEEKIKEYFPEVAIGDRLAILDERDNFQVRPHPRRTLPSAEGPTVLVEDIYPSAANEISNQPVQCPSHRFSLDCFVLDKKQSKEDSHNQQSPGEPDSNQTELRDCTEHETPLKVHADKHVESPRDPVVPHETAPSRKRSIEDLHESPKGESSKEDQQSAHIDQKQVRIGSVTSEDEFETPLKQPVDSAANDADKTSQCRKFTTEMGLMTYLRGSRISCNEGQRNDPICFHKFVDIEAITTRKDRVTFAKEIVQFLCACLNERYNGTIHFGVIGKDDERMEQVGTIKGVEICSDIFSEFEDEFKKCVHKCFAADQIDLVFHCIHPLQYIPLEPKEQVQGQQQLYVIELDVSPASVLGAQEAFFAKLPSYQDKNVVYSPERLFRHLDGHIRTCSDKEVQAFMEKNHKIAQDLKQKKELQMQAKVQQDAKQEVLNVKLCNLMCRAEDNLPVDTYPILCLNKPPESWSTEEMQNKLSFLARVPFKVTLDFDKDGTVSEYIDNVEKKKIKIISTADDFSKNSDPNLKSPDRLRSLQEDIRNSAIQSWVFVNGHRKDRKTPFEWKRQNRDGFRDTIKFFQEEIPDKRALVVFLLLSEDQDVMIEAAEELIASFQDQWMVISESEELADAWEQALIRRHSLVDTDKTWKTNSIIGVPLSDISESVQRMQGPVRMQCPTVVTSSGAVVPMEQRFPDLDVLSANECERHDPQPPQRFKLQKEEEYYKGGQVDWWNFYYEHVLNRSKLSALKELIRKALKGGIDEDMCVGRIGLYHQIGSGGTSLAMNALWDFRKTNRCAVVNTISDAATTAQQILNLRQYGETSSPKPVLILLDNLEEDKSLFLLAELETKSKQMRDDYGKSSVVCVLINCIRRNNLPTSNKNNSVLLKHELDDKEIDWFKKKYLTMEKEHANHHGVDPKLLISFNIMKENFDEKYMERTVSNLFKELKDHKERELIKYVALLNAFDIQCQAIPTAAFDMMMNKIIWTTAPRHGAGAYAYRWETNLSTAAQVLLNVTTQVSMGYIHAIEIVSPLLSRHILEAIKRDQTVKQTFSDMAMDFFGNSIFKAKSLARDNLLKVIKNVLKFRAKGANGLPEKKFAPIIQEIIKSEGIDKASQVMEEGFKLTEDPFIAQQLARVYIEASNWEKAKKYAKIATDKKSENSFLWDTYGRVHLHELMESCASIVATDRQLLPDACAGFVDCAFEGMKIFQRVQKISQDEKSSYNNNAGYFGELETIRFLLECLSYVRVFETTDHMKQFLVEPEFEVSGMEELDNESDGACRKLKCLMESCRNAITGLEDAFIQLREDHLDDSKRLIRFRNVKKLEELKVHFDSYFGEEDDEPRSTLSPEEQCKYRARRLFQLGATSMSRIFDLKRKGDGEETLKRIKTIVSKNINTPFEAADDLQILICTNLALVQKSQVHLKNIVFEDMVRMSQRLYEKRGTRTYKYLEPYLFYIMFNWPQEKAEEKPKEKSSENTVQTTVPHPNPINHRMFTDALLKWQEAYFEKYPKQRDESKHYRMKDTTIFFFANGSAMNSIVSQEVILQDATREKLKGAAFWKLPRAQDDLMRFEGILMSYGEEVELTIVYPEGNKAKITLPTSFPIRDRDWWNKKVYFVIGFSWRGPKAFDVSTEDPTNDLATRPTPNPGVNVRSKSNQQGKAMKGGIESHPAYQRKLAQFNHDLDEIEMLKQRKETNPEFSQKELTLLREEDNIRKMRRDLTEKRAKEIKNRKEQDYFV